MTKLPANWSNKKLDELGFVGRGKSKHRPRNAPELYGGPYPFIQTADVMRSEFYITSYSQTYSEAGLAQSKLWHKDTLCISIAGENTAESAILTFTACFPDSIIGFVADSDKADVRFIKYYLDTIKYQIKSVTKGATQDNLSLEKLLSFDIRTPPAEVQRRIASILSAYDDLIENNTRRIKLLEQMAQAIYREWFVEFRAPGVKLRKATSEEQKVTGKDRFPVGWELKQLGDLIELAYGKALKADTRVPGQVPVYGSAGITGYHNESLVTGPGIIVGRKGNVGSVFWSDEDFFPIDTAFYVVTELNLHYVYYNLREQNFINSDAAVPGLSRNQAYLNPFVVPALETLSLFGEFIDPLFGQIQNLTKKNANLRQTRDLLLPRLVGGEVNVENIDIAVEV